MSATKKAWAAILRERSLDDFLFNRELFLAAEEFALQTQQENVESQSRACEVEPLTVESMRRELQTMVADLEEVQRRQSPKTDLIDQLLDKLGYSLVGDEQIGRMNVSVKTERGTATYLYSKEDLIAAIEGRFNPEERKS